MVTSHPEETIEGYNGFVVLKRKEGVSKSVAASA